MLSNRDLENLLPDLDRIVAKTLGKSESSISAILERGLTNGYTKQKYLDKLEKLIESRKAEKLVDKLETIINNYKDSQKSKKRSHDDENGEREVKKSRTKSTGEDESAPAPLPSYQIKQMMENAQKQIEERKRKLEAIKGGPILPATTPTSTVLSIATSGGTPLTGVDERTRKIAELQKQIQAKLQGSLGLLSTNPALLIQKPTVDKPRPLILDEEGRTVDTSGREINIQTLTPTLKANIRAKKKENFKHQQNEKIVEEAKNQEPSFFDDRIMVKPAVRTKRNLRFHEPGKFQQMGERMRMKAQLEKLQNEISQIARKTGISSATKLALIAPKTDIHSDEVPTMEWWDSVILDSDLNKMVNGKISIREQAITNLIEHPTQMRPPNESNRPAYLPVFLTKKERKKLRRQNRREAWKEEQEKIRLGLKDAPEPKLRISNLMRVLGTEAVQDPTKIEAHVREQMARRQKAHEDANAARKLTHEQKREKKIKKLKEDTTNNVHVSVYRIKDLSNQSKKFKVETNAKQLFMTGVVVLFRDCCVVVVEGGPKQQKKYRRLMMNRIKWEEDLVKGDGSAEADKEALNSCKLVWEGKIMRRNFGEVKFKSFTTEKMVREFFQKHHCEHYWDLAFSGAVLEASVDDI